MFNEATSTAQFNVFPVSYAMTRKLNDHLVWTAETRVRRQSKLCWICGEQSGRGTGLTVTSLTF
jgi:hypothetical protein